MTLDFNDFLNVQQHHKKIEHGAQELREKYALSPIVIKQYAHDLFDFFLDDIRKVASDIYQEILHKKYRLDGKLNFTPADLRTCIENGTYSLLTSYNRIIANINMGGMFRDFDNANQEKTLFNEEAQALCKKQSEIFETKYIKLLEKNRREYLTYIGVVVGGVAGLMGIIIALIPAKAMLLLSKALNIFFLCSVGERIILQKFFSCMVLK